MLTATYGFAQTDSGMKGDQKGEMKQQGMKMDEGMMSMMKKMMDDKKEMMQMMMGMMDMQEKMIKGPKAAEKKQMMKDMTQMKEKMQKSARYTLKKTKNINLRLTEPDVHRLKIKAIEEGIPYQTLAASILHKYVTAG